MATGCGCYAIHVQCRLRGARRTRALHALYRAAVRGGLLPEPVAERLARRTQRRIRFQTRCVHTGWRWVEDGSAAEP